MNYGNLLNYYKTNFALIHHHKYSLNEIENMIPFERDIYVDMLLDYLKKIEQQTKE